jgi:hypothetical protein
MAHVNHVDHPLPTPEEARERGQMRRAASDGTQTAVWVWFLVTLAVLVALGVAWGLRHRLSPQLPNVEPELPTLPGKPPEPQLNP